MAALIDLALHGGGAHVSLGSIAERNQISPQYLEQVFASLRRAGIVRSVKGSQGGYLLNRAASDITVADIVHALEGSYHLEPELQARDGSLSDISRTIQEDVVDRVNDGLDRILKNLTLAELERDCLDRETEGQDMYYI